MNIIKSIKYFFVSFYNAMVEARLAKARHMTDFYKKHGYMPSYYE